MSALSVILYRYDISVFSHKIDHVLLLKNIPYKAVTVSPILPRPEITDLLGVKYRQIPILAIGNDIYCDTSLIVPVLERRFPESNSLFPRRKGSSTSDTGPIQAFVRHFSDQALFFDDVTCIPWEGIDPKFLEDRMKLVGSLQRLINPDVAPRGKSNLYAHMTLIDSQLKDNREWLFDTGTPGYADAAVFSILNWLRSPAFRGLDAVFDEAKFSNVMKWLARMSVYLESLNTHNNIIEAEAGDEAGKAIAAATFEPYEATGFDEIMGSWLDLARGDIVSIAPSQNYNAKDYSTVGKLASLNREEYCIEIQGNLGTFRCHFPIIGFTARKVE